MIGDLRDPYFVRFDEIYPLAADMGGAGYIFTGENDADLMTNSALINLNALDACHKRHIPRIFYSSSACMYPEYNQGRSCKILDAPRTAHIRLLLIAGGKSSSVKDFILLMCAITELRFA